MMSDRMRWQLLCAADFPPLCETPVFEVITLTIYQSSNEAKLKINLTNPEIVGRWTLRVHLQVVCHNVGAI